MDSELKNNAAWFGGAKGEALKVGPGPDQSDCSADEVIIKVAYVAINPSEWKVQEHQYLPQTLPHVLGSDVAGEIVKVGEQVTRFKLGDRVIGHCAGLSFGGPKHGGFQNYTTCKELVVAKIPDRISFAHAVVLPLGLSTSITGLFEHLQLKLPSVEPKSTGKTIVIWGGSSSMGSTGIQLAAAAGYKVITTASPRNHEYVKSLGATEVFDHSAPDIVDLILGKLDRYTFAGVYDCIGEEVTTRSCAKILSELGGGVLPTVLWPPSDLPENVKAVLVFATNPALVPNHVGAKVWKDFVPAALEAGTFLPKPDPKIISGGLEAIQRAMDLQKKGVSAQKIVVEI